MSTDQATNTALDPELIERFKRSFDTVAGLLEDYESDMKAAIESHPAGLKEQAALLSMLNAHDPDQLKKLLERAAKFRPLANDARGSSTRPNDLLTKE
jgi:hypothetical protein